MILIIDHKSVVIRHQAGRLLIERQGKTACRYPVTQLDQVIVYGNPLVETAVWRALSAAGVPSVLLSARGKVQVAMLGSGLATQLPLRRLQHRCADCRSAAVTLAKHFVDLKLASYGVSSSALVESYHASDDAVGAFIARCEHARSTLLTTMVHDGVLGLEGQAARAWFELLADRLPPHWNFTGRNRRPPRDPINALLSLGYTLLASEIRQVLISSGLDPSLGFLHCHYPGREALVLDFVEIFRSGVDRFVLGWTADAVLDRSSFYYRNSEGCRLSKAARPLFYRAWATYRENWPRPINQRDAEQWPCVHIREQVLGQIEVVRARMKHVMDDNDDSNSA